MKKLVSLHILCLFFLTACANNNNQIPESLSSSYDGIWDGYAQTSEERVYIKGEIKNGVAFGLIGDIKVKGYITSDNNLIINPIYIKRPATAWWRAGWDPCIICETTFMSPDRIEGIYYLDQVQAEKSIRYKWYVVKPATGKTDITTSGAKSDTTISNIRVNEKEPWTGKFKLEPNYQCSGIWAMKQEGQTVKSTVDSEFDFTGNVQGNQLTGKVVGASSTYYTFTLEMSSNCMSITGTLDLIAHGLPCQLKGKRIE